MHERSQSPEPADHHGRLARWRARRAAENAALAEADARIPSQLDRWNRERLQGQAHDRPDE